MALKKSVSLTTGHSAEYHRIQAIRYDTMEVVVDTFKDQEARQTAKMPVLNRAFIIADLSEDRPGAYAALKALPEFSGAEDC